LPPGNYYVAEPWQKALGGTVICARDDFLLVGGYDELYQGWAGEDRDLYDHFHFSGVKKQGFPQEWLTEIPHGDDLRVRYHATKSPHVSQTINTLYRHAKFDLMRLTGRALNNQERGGLYAEAVCLVQTWHDNQQEAQWRIPVRPTTCLHSSEISSTLVYTLKRSAV
jgi:N-terminal domain of galactosyltransferase